MVVDLVRSRGGAATKLSNRFLVGVADLLVKMLGANAALIEVKLHHVSKVVEGLKFTLDVTPLQRKFLSGYDAAGMACGVLSFVEVGGRGKLGLRARMFSLDRLGASGYRVAAGDHLVLDINKRDEILMMALEEVFTYD